MSIDAINKKPTIYLHIGMNKTGSTALQAWLSTNKEKLLRSGSLYYPDEGLQGGAHYGLSSLFGFKQGRQFINESEVKKLQASFLQSIKENNCQKVVFSSENFVINKDLSTIKQFFQGFECKIIVYLRRHDYWWESSYNQSLKMIREPKFEKGIEAYLKHQKKVSNIGNYKALLERWANAFGRKNIIVRAYEKSSLSNGIVDDFLKVIGCVDFEHAASENKLNVSLSKYANAILEVAQRSGLSDSDINKVLTFLKANDKQGNHYSLMSPQRRRRMINNYLPQYQYIATEYLNNENSILFSEKWPQADDKWEAFKQPEPEEIVETIVKALK